MVKKRAPEKVEKKRDAIQHCIDGVMVSDVLKSVPNGIKIIGCRIRFGYPIKRKKIVVPREIAKAGCNYLQQIMAGLEAEVTLDETTPTQIRKSCKVVAEYIGADPDLASFRYITLSNGQGTGKFVACTKEMTARGPDAADLRKKLKVMGLEDAQGRIQSLIADIHAGGFRCNFQEVTVKQISLCERVK